MTCYLVFMLRQNSDPIHRQNMYTVLNSLSSLSLTHLPLLIVAEAAHQTGMQEARANTVSACNVTLIHTGRYRDIHPDNYEHLTNCLSASLKLILHAMEISDHVVYIHGLY